MSSAPRSGNKRHRIRAHVNPLAIGDYEYPKSADVVQWVDHYPKFYKNEDNDSSKPCVYIGAGDKKEVTFADVGCGFGGLLVTLSPLFPNNLILGLEIRPKVVKYVKGRILNLRATSEIEHKDDEVAQFNNISVERTNVMKFFPNYFKRGQLEKIFFCFPDPHFKKSNHRRRIISHNLISEYAYALKEGGMIYTISDVFDLHEWMASHLQAHPLFERVDEELLKDDPAIEAIKNGTEEGKKVTKNGGSKYLAIFRKIKCE